MKDTDTFIQLLITYLCFASFLFQKSFRSFQNSTHKPSGLQTTEQRDHQESCQGGLRGGKGGRRRGETKPSHVSFCCCFLNKAAIGLAQSDKCLIINLNINGWLEKKKKRWNLKLKRKKEKEERKRRIWMTGSSHFFTSVKFQSPATTTCFLFTDNLYNIFYHSVLDTVERLLPKAWNTLKIVYHLQGFLLLHCAIRWLSFYRRRIYHLRTVDVCVCVCVSVCVCLCVCVCECVLKTKVN